MNEQDEAKAAAAKEWANYLAMQSHYKNVYSSEQNERMTKLQQVLDDVNYKVKDLPHIKEYWASNKDTDEIQEELESPENDENTNPQKLVIRTPKNVNDWTVNSKGTKKVTKKGTTNRTMKGPNGGSKRRLRKTKKGNKNGNKGRRQTYRKLRPHL